MIEWFEGTTEHLEVQSEFEVETQRDNPFDYLPADLDGNVLPMSYGGLEQELLSPYLMPPGNGDGRLADFAPDIAEGVDYQA